MASYGIWRHESSLGNSAEQIVNLCHFIKQMNDKDPIIYVESDFQKYFAMCIEEIIPENIRYYSKEIEMDRLNENVMKYYGLLKDIYMPDVYFRDLPYYYPSVWENLSMNKCLLKFPYKYYEHKFDHLLPKDAIVIQFRQAKTYWHRIDGDNMEPRRFVDPLMFGKVALHYANKGFKVVKIGDPRQMLFPSHPNIIDFGCFQHQNKTILDDLYLIDNCKVFLSCDSGVWPMAGGMKKKLVLSNVACVFNGEMKLYKECIVKWMVPEITRVIYKDIINGQYMDNSFEQLIQNVDSLL